MSNHISGRHRAPGRLNPASSLSTAISRSAKPAAKASAVIAITGGMVASFALPASAATSTIDVKQPALAATGALAMPAPSAAEAPLVSPAFGDIGFTGVTKPKPKPKPVVAVRSTDRASRSVTRAPAPRTAGVLGIAASLEGIYYIWGGTTPAGFDCSGYTQYVYRQLGISLPRTAEQQRQFTTPVTNPVPGDLVFVGVPAHHVGIYAGNGKLWNSPQTGSTVSLRPVHSSDVTYGRV